MICFSVYSASLAFNQLYRSLIGRFGLTYSQFVVLVALWAKDGQKVSELGEALHLESNTLTPLLKRLEAAGLVDRKRDEKDERVVRIWLTDKGVALAMEMDCVPPQVFQAANMQLDDLQALTSKLNTLSTTLRQHTNSNQA